MSILGILAIIASLINMWYSFHERIENFFWNLPSYGLIALGLFLDHAYASSLMWLIQGIISFYGFFIWTKKRDLNTWQTLVSIVHDKHHKLDNYRVIDTSTMSWQQHSYAGLSIIFITIIVYWVLAFSNDISPIIDALSFAILTVAAIGLNYKKLESWIYYIVADIFSIALAIKAFDWYNICSILIFIILDGVCYYRWHMRLKSRSN